jgi:hypothetical protein
MGTMFLFVFIVRLYILELLLHFEYLLILSFIVRFHILSDFDEGKRSCRRKLERHNNRRRRKPTDGKGVIEQEGQLATLSEDISCDDETAKGTKSMKQHWLFV